MTTLTIVSIVVGVGVLWTVWGAFSSRVEHTAYTVLSTSKSYEIRLYPAHIVAQTVVTGPYQEALNEGFRIVADYIFGGNVKKERIAMTSPVVERSATASETTSGTTPAQSVPIAMTAPVTATLEGEARTIAFGMPRSYTLETLPTPTDPRVKIVTLPEKKMAVLRFSWLRTDSRVEAYKKELLAALKADGITTVGDPQYAGYNAPWTPPWMTRHEVMVEVK